MSSSTSSSDQDGKPAQARSLKAFFLGLALPLGVLLLLCGGSSLFLQKSGEYMALDDIIAKQEKTTGLYGSALFQRAYHYKQHLYKRVKPSVVTIGSSRVLEFRATDFSKPFVNLGSMSDLNHLIGFADTTFTEHKPDLVILGIDVWWFHPSYVDAFVTPSEETVSPSVRDLMEPFYWLAKGKLSFHDISSAIRGKTPHIGIAAITRGDGYSVDGSYHYNAALTGLVAADDPGFEDSLAKIESGAKIYAHAEHHLQTQVEKLAGLLERLSAQGIPVVMLIPPFAPTVTKAMKQQGGYKYIDEARQALAEMAESKKLPFFDFHEAGNLGSSDCEFIDGHHGGPIVYQRILLDMSVGNEAVRSVAKLAEIGWNIENYGGRASMLENEIDFLGLGCKKR